MTKQEMQKVENVMILTLLLALAEQREGKGKITPCGNCASIADGLTTEHLDEGRVIYMLWYNVGPDTHAVRIVTDTKAEESNNEDD